MEARTKHKEVRCDFCSKTEDQVEIIIRGSLADICNECVDLCAALVADIREKRQAEAQGRPGPKTEWTWG
ncbi:MAG: hypothetical protein OJF49_001489 [Ktedonobacterales bacterium]|jgi:ATP-dependent Clp protease ATP-binding subunit ClpX|nr:MAG: hypothetical protein OJF49_001489 [Ktedonobacterales bacterium]